IEPKSKQLSDTKGQIRVLENEKIVLVAELAQAKIDHHKVVREFIQVSQDVPPPEDNEVGSSTQNVDGVPAKPNMEDAPPA
ncbi:hypothetical protein Tco_1398573, partial [Tanacetum coccineum]